MELKKEIRAIQGKIRESRQIESHIDNLRELIRQKEVHLQVLEDRVAFRKDYVNNLINEKTGIRKLFKSVLGNNQEQIEEKRQELLNSILDLKDARSEMISLKYELELLESKLENVKHLKDQLEVYYEMRAEEILKNFVKEKIRWKMLDGLKSRYEQKLIEIDEAKLHLEQLVNQILRLRDLLVQIRNWKKTEFLSYSENKQRKGMADLVKDRANELQTAMDLFHVELKDVWRQKDTDIDSKYGALINFVYDLNHSLILDWVAQKQMQSAMETLDEMLNECKEIENELNVDVVEHKEKLQRNEKDIDDLMAGWSKS